MPNYGHRATRAEIAKNDFTLIIPLYVETLEAEKEVDLKNVQREIEELEMQLAGGRAEVAGHLKELGL
jgi:type I restriction enzyme M protein